VKKELQDCRKKLEKLVTDREFQLGLAESALCESVPAGGLFRVVLDDCSLRVAELVMTRFQLFSAEGSVQLVGEKRLKSAMALMALAQEKSKKGEVDTAAQMSEYAKELGATGSIEAFKSAVTVFKQNLNERIFDCLPIATKQDLQEFAETFMRAGATSLECGNYNQALQDLEKCRTVLQKRNLESPELCLHFGVVFSYFAKRSEAEAVLKRGLESSSVPDMKMQLSNTLAETYYQAGRWTDTISLCEEVLRSWGSSQSGFELLRTLYFLINAHYYLGKISEGFTLVADWVDKQEPDTQKAQCLLHFIKADKCLMQGWNDQGVAYYEAGLQLAETHLSQSYHTACSRHMLGFLYKAV